MDASKLVKQFFKVFKLNVSRQIDFEKTVLTHLLGCTPNPVIVDVGAYVGEKSMYYKKIFPEAQVFCFEPFVESFNKLTTNVSAKKNVRLENIALSNYRGKAQFSVKTGFDQGNSLFESSNEEFGTIAADIMKESAKVEVDVNTLDNYADEHDITKIDLLKLDIQGAELLALEGAEQLLKDKKIDFIYLEGQFLKMYKDQVYFHDICKYLYEKDYRLYNLFDSQSIGYQLREINALFYRKDLKV